jgi:integrase
LPLDKISSSDIEHYKNHRLHEKASVATINRELAVLSHLFNKAIEWQWLDKRIPSIKRFKEGSGRIVYLTVEQIKRLLKAAENDQNPHIYLFILIGLETAMRRMEILSIKLEDIDLQRRVIYIPKAKAGKREQPITANLANYLTRHLNTIEPQQIWLFPAKNSDTGHTVNIEKPFRRVVEAAGLDPKMVVRHTLRHTAITHLVQAGIDLPTVKRISGHKTLQMVERYSHQNGAHIQAAMDKLEERYKEV